MQRGWPAGRVRKRPTVCQCSSSARVPPHPLHGKPLARHRERSTFDPRQPAMVGHAVVVRAFAVLIVAGSDREPAQARLRVRVAIDFILERLRSSWAKQPLISAA